MFQVKQDRLKNDTVHEWFNNISHILDLIMLRQARWIAKIAMMDDKKKPRKLLASSIILGKWDGHNYATVRLSQKPITQ
jgi:hypothetical protein